MAFGESSASDTDGIVRELLDRVKANSRRIRDVEEENRSLNKGLKSIEERVINFEKRVDRDRNDILDEIDDISTRIMKLENRLMKIKERLEDVPRKHEVEEIRNFKELLSPIKSEFLTESEARQIINDELDDRGI